MNSSELNQLLRDMEDLERRDVLFAHVLIGVVDTLEQLRETLISGALIKEGIQSNDH